MTDPPTAEASWQPWRVAPRSGFEALERGGAVGLVQIDARRFLVTVPFRYGDQAVVDGLTGELVRAGWGPAPARAAVDRARTFTPTTENPTDLASIPRYLRWFESPYGAHTLAAILHDELIVEAPNTGALGSDTLADRFFREMLRTTGVPWLKRWIMWAAVALRSRWAAGGIRRVSVATWVLLAVAGMGTFLWSVGAMARGWSGPVGPWTALGVAVVLPAVAAPLWGRQYGAALVASLAALWILPAAALGGLGYLVYLGLERLAGRAGLR